MNFDYVREVGPKTGELVELWDRLCQNLERAEEMYWKQPQKSGMMLRKATEEICHIYNCYYEIGFPKHACLEDYLCYTEEEAHNILVSRFLSVVRSEQRDRLEWLRVWGDECIFMDANPDTIEQSQDKLYLNVKKMMVYMMNTAKELCVRLFHLQHPETYTFNEEILPGYVSVEEREELERLQEEAKKKHRFSLWRKSSRDEERNSK